jgi:hypothetical protein
LDHQGKLHPEALVMATILPRPEHWPMNLLRVKKIRMQGLILTWELCFSESFKVSRTCAKFFARSCSARFNELSVHSKIGGKMWESTRFLRKGGLSAEKSNAADITFLGRKIC